MQQIDTKIIVPFKDKDIEFLTRSESGYDVTVTDKIVIREIFVDNVYEIFEDDVNDTGVVVDIGMNIGAFSLFAWALGAKRVVGFEPDTHNLDILQQNINNNKASNEVFVNPVGIYSKEGEVELLNGQGASYIIGNKTPTPEAQRIIDSTDTPREKIHVVTLEQALIANGITYADVLKVDCEGSEYAIFASTPSDVINKFKKITVEYHATTASNFGKMLAKLSETHNTRFFGSYKTGGQLIANRY